MHALFNLCCLHYILIYNLEVSFIFRLTFVQLNMIKMFTVQQKLVFPFHPAIASSSRKLELPITRTFNDFP